MMSTFYFDSCSEYERVEKLIQQIASCRATNCSRHTFSTRPRTIMNVHSFDAKPIRLCRTLHCSRYCRILSYWFNFLPYVHAIDNFLFSRLQVSWVRRRDDQLHLITFGSSIYISDSRYSLEFKEPNDWQLHIQYANERDEGQFECQINTNPPSILIVHLEVIGEYTEYLAELFMTHLFACSHPIHLHFTAQAPTPIRNESQPLSPNLYMLSNLTILRHSSLCRFLEISIELGEGKKDIKSWVLGFLCVWEISFSFHNFFSSSDDSICDMLCESCV